MAKTEAYTTEQFLDAIKESGGFVTEIAHRLRCSVTTVYAYKKKYAEIAAAMYDEKERILDSTESSLLKQIKAGNVTAIIFYLKTQGYHRAYGDRSKLDIDGKFISKADRKNNKSKDAAYIAAVMKELKELQLKGEDDDAAD